MLKVKPSGAVNLRRKEYMMEETYYAICQQGDWDWGYGSTDYHEALAMLCNDEDDVIKEIYSDTGKPENAYCKAIYRVTFRSNAPDDLVWGNNEVDPDYEFTAYELKQMYKDWKIHEDGVSFREWLEQSFEPVEYLIG